MFLSPVCLVQQRYITIHKNVFVFINTFIYSMRIEEEDEEEEDEEEVVVVVEVVSPFIFFAFFN